MSDDLPTTPPSSPSLTSNRPLLGMALVIGATLLFACNDVSNKLLVTHYPVPLVMGIRYIVHTLLMLAILGPRQGRQLVETKRTSLVVIRSLCLVVATLFLGLGLQRMPVPETTSLIYLSPILVMLLARPVLGERIGPAGWIATLAGFAGVLLIVRPGSGLDPMGVVFIGCNIVVTVVYYLLSRILAHSERTIALLFYSALAGAICFGILIPWNIAGEAPALWQVALMLSLGVTAGGGHFLFTAAYRYAEASILAPVNYLQLLWAGLLSWIVFGHLPETLTIIGMVVVVGAGLLTAIASTRRLRPAQPIAPLEAV